MGIFSKIFGGDTLEMTDVNDSSDDKNESQSDNKNGDKNKTVSPFLMDDEDEKNE